MYTFIMTRVLTATQARKEFLKLVDQVDEKYSRVDIVKKGKVKVAIVCSDYLDSLEETIYSLTYSLKDIRKAQKEVAQGKYVTLEQIEEDYKKRLAKNAR